MGFSITQLLSGGARLYQSAIEAVTRPKNAILTGRKRSRLDRFSFETLEPREMLAGAQLDASTKVLSIYGSNNNDTAAVYYAGTLVRVVFDGLGNFDFPAAQVTSLDFVGLAGDDRFTNATSLPSRMFGHTGNDVLLGGSGIDHIFGGHGDDYIQANDGNDLIIGIGGNDQIFGGNGNDEIYGSYTGTNLIYGDAGDDLIHGGRLADTIYGGDGADHIYGGEGNDTLFTNAGGVPGFTDYAQVDLAVGYDGDDVIIGQSGMDIFWGGKGNDTLTGGNGNNQIYGQEGNDTIRGGYIDDLLFGHAGDDIIFGGGGNDYLGGGDGNDSLYGENGLDQVFGDAGNDGIYGGVGHNEWLRGGPGADRFLMLPGEMIGDRDASDVVINFSGSWNDLEIESLDRGLRALHHRTGSTAIFVDPLDRDPMEIRKVAAGSLGAGNRGLNDLKWSATATANGTITSETYNRTYSIADWNEGIEIENEWAGLSIIHEIAHAWDSNFEISKKFPALATRWDYFTTRSNWKSSNPGAGFTRSLSSTAEPFERVFNAGTGNYDIPPKNWWYQSNSSFARDYGKLSPKEDWATTWESVFVDQIVANPTPAHAVQIAAKVNIVNQLLDAF